MRGLDSWITREASDVDDDREDRCPDCGFAECECALAEQWTEEDEQDLRDHQKREELIRHGED